MWHACGNDRAGQVLGTVVAYNLPANAAFRADRDAAEAELRAAKVIP